MRTKAVAFILTVVTGSATAGQASSPHEEFYDDCDQLHDAYGRVAPDEQQTEISGKANRTAERSPQPAPVPSYKEVANAQG
jgi:hypothetical protein